jgi:hypothetical protein
MGVFESNSLADLTNWPLRVKEVPADIFQNNKFTRFPILDSVSDPVIPSGLTGITSIGTSAFRANLMTEVDLSAYKAVAVIGEQAFSGQQGGVLDTVMLPPQDEDRLVVKAGAFSGNDKITIIAIGSNVSLPAVTEAPAFGNGFYTYYLGANRGRGKYTWTATPAPGSWSGPESFPPSY